MNQRCRVYFSGSVQGVGFRYTVLILAKNFNLTGWVRNRSDGRVELLVEGSEPVVESLLCRIEEKMHGYVEKKLKYCEVATGEFSEFEILPTL